MMSTTAGAGGGTNGWFKTRSKGSLHSQKTKDEEAKSQTRNYKKIDPIKQVAHVWYDNSSRAKCTKLRDLIPQVQ